MAPGRDQGALRRMGRYAEAYPQVFDGQDERTVRIVEQVLGSRHDGGLWSEQDAQHLLDRVSGKISFEEYLRQKRAPVAGRGPDRH